MGTESNETVATGRHLPTMFAVRGSKWYGKRGWSNRPDGMLLRADGSWTGRRENAALWSSSVDAENAARASALWNHFEGIKSYSPLYVVEVAVEPIMARQLKVCSFNPGRQIKDGPFTGEAP